MKTVVCSRVGWGIVVAALVVGCATVPYVEPMQVGQVKPGLSESVAVDQVIILTDASGSMKARDKFPLKKALVEAFAGAMPEGDYQSGLLSFGGYAESRWLMMPLEQFSHRRMTRAAADVKYLGGGTPFARALDTLGWDLGRMAGKAALVVFSDGEPQSEEAALIAAQVLKGVHRGDFCVHTVQVGSSASGEDFLRRLSNLSDCGSFRNGMDINDPSAMAAFVREVFFGAAKDSDGDGVPDHLDECPDTPKGVKVDKVGCPLDSDGDGVPDHLDECPDTPKGVKVDKVGCPLDEDGDGVPDYKDECPHTPKGAKVDERGCWTLRGLNFDYDKYEIKPEYRGRLDDAVQVLKKNPTIRVLVEGHTDSKGSEAYNQVLSENRAKAVRDYMVGAGIAAERLVVKGFGESRPIKPNDTPENMYLNRRVELSVIE